jgi:hypothetical protein
MKKVIFILVLLVIAAGAALYFGWINIKPGTFGVAHSTITGTIEEPLESGKIHWLWQKLIPKSFHLYTVQKEPVNLSFESTYALPGSEQLEEFGRFDIIIQTSIQYSINFDAARKLIESGLFSEFSEYFTDLLSSQVDDAIAGFVLERMIYSQYDVEINYRTLESLKEDIEEKIQSTMQEYLIEDASWSITYQEIPQLELYMDALNRYFSHLETVYRYKEQQLDRESEYLARQKENDLEIDRWRKYGELIDKHPQLLKYFYIEKLSGQADVLVLPQNEATGFPKMLEPMEFALREPPGPLEKTTQPGEDEEAEAPTSHDIEQDEVETGEPESAGAERELSETDTAMKWYEKLMFWKLIGKQDEE